LLVILLIVLAACGTTNAQPVASPAFWRWHDDEKNVTCWVAPRDNISCIPDKALQ